MPPVALAPIFGLTLYMAASAVAVMPDTAGSLLAQAVPVGMVSLLHAATGFLVLAEKAQTALASRQSILLAGLALAATAAATAVAAIAAVLRPFPISADLAAPTLAVAIAAAAVCSATAARRSYARAANHRDSATLHSG